MRYLQTLNSISAENNSTIIFPVPIDVMSQLMTPAFGAIPPVQVRPPSDLYKFSWLSATQLEPPTAPVHCKAGVRDQDSSIR